jgi:hypothetical protein
MTKMLALFRTIGALAGSFTAGVVGVAMCGAIYASITDSVAQEAPRYCSASAFANATNELPEPIIQAIRQRCAIGDTIMVSASQIMVIGRVCDFGKTIANAGRNVVCAFAGDRGGR